MFYLQPSPPNFRGYPNQEATVSVVEGVLDLARSRTPFGRNLRKALYAMSQWSLQPGAAHRWLLAERSLRRQVVDELMRATYYQPLF